ncbi:MAG: 50S ribosomal protein L15 [Nitrospirae bacterium RIFCSPLOWO2_02_42_7]|uniref:Large ribosomal subunit protein uL15 n=1 Tax=uncultured Nitrospirae bacterium Rifle_16ft_4_minimus_4901 TaxID=1665132 RepID=A0A0H4TTY6_9BACT|nr:50S ribosomal protein L15, large subunit ribosomal protein L15 [uncultured Nitrospirae bacterium Rifle_16ft_4_minimus_4901]OGW54765.1 MAG: 50S ribosomal protein L15 [Nitrospirae bacterium RIFCSPLOWO2_02_42_7]
MKLNELIPAQGSRKKKKKVGRGPGSGHGKTSAKGHKGQLARSGGGKGPGFEGGQMPLQRRLIKRGFKNLFKKEFQIVNLDTLEKFFSDGETVNPETLKEKGLISKTTDVKILSRGLINKPLMIKANRFSKGAIEKIRQAGGKAEVI